MGVGTLLLLLLLEESGSLVEAIQELHVHWVLETRLDMEGGWKIVEGVLFGQIVVFAHSVEQGFLVADNTVVLEVVVHLRWAWRTLQHPLLFEMLPTTLHLLIQFTLDIPMSHEVLLPHL